MNFAQFKSTLGLSGLPVETIEQIDVAKLMRYLAGHIAEAKGSTLFDTIDGIEGKTKVFFGGDDHFSFWFDPYHSGPICPIYFAGECPSGNMDRDLDCVFKFNLDMTIALDGEKTRGAVIFGLAQTDLMRSMSAAMRGTNGFMTMLQEAGKPSVDKVANEAVGKIKARCAPASNPEGGLLSMLEALGLVPKDRRATTGDEDLNELVNMMTMILFNAPLEIAQGIAEGLSEGMPEKVVEIFNNALSHRAAGAIVDVDSVKAGLRRAFVESMEEEFKTILAPGVAKNEEESDERIKMIMDANIPGVKIVSGEGEEDLPPELRQLMSQASNLGISVKAVRLDLSGVPKEDVPMTMDRINEVLKAGAKTKD